LKHRFITLYYAVCAFLVYWPSLIPSQLADPDLWGRLSIAALWFNSGIFPYQDVFSFTATHQPWIDHEWLSGVLFYLALWWGGEIGLHVLKYGLIVGIFYLLFSSSFSYSCSPGHKLNSNGKMLPLWQFLALILLLPTFGDAFYPTIRAQLFSFLGFLGFLHLLENERQTASKPPLQFRSLWLCLPIGVFWANAHGGFILGLILLALYGLGEALSHRSIKAMAPYGIMLIALVTAIALLNPYGLTYWPFILQALTMPRPFISEWNPLPLWTVDFWEIKLLMLLTLASLIFIGWGQIRAKAADNTKPKPLTPGLVLLFLMGLAIKGLRFKIFFMLGLLFYAPMLIDTFRKQPSQPALENPKTGFNFIHCLPGIAACGAMALVLTFYRPTYYAHTVVQTGDLARAQGLVPFPVQMMQYLKNSPYRGNLIAPFTWGEFLAWNLYPHFKVNWDGRYEEVYPPSVMNFYTEFYALPHGQNPHRMIDMANRSAGDFILIETISPNQKLMDQNPQWRLLVTDGFYYLYGRNSTLNHFPLYSATLPQLASPPATISHFFQPKAMRRFQSL
jgi:hypothetical protein